MQRENLLRPSTSIPAIFVLTLGAAQMGCVTRGKNFSSSTDWINETHPTQSQVQKLMGPPYMLGSSNGTTTWTYGYYKHQLFGESQVKELKIYWNDDKTVKTYSFSSSFPEDTSKAVR